MIDFGLDEDLQLIKDTVADFAMEQLRPNLRAFEKAGGVSDELRASFHELGMTSLAIPEALGGQGLDLRAHVIVNEALATGDVGAAADLDRSGGPIHVVLTLGSEAQQQDLLTPFTDPGKPDYTASLAWHEPVAGTDLAETATTATGEGDSATLTGSKLLVIAAEAADYFLVTARVAGTEGEDGLRVYVVRKGATGLAIGPADTKIGLGTLTTHPVTLTDTPAELLAGSTDLGALKTALRKVQLLGAARTVGMTQGASDYSLQYAKDRQTFGKPISEHQAIAFKLADGGILVNGARWQVWRAAAVLADGGDGAIEVPEAMMQAAETGRFVTCEGVQILGGHGYIKDHPVEKWMRDARAQEVLYGIAELESLTLADALLV